MKKANQIIWGITLVAVSVVLSLKYLNIVKFDLFFDGWWTLFIIVPSIIGLITEKDKSGSLIGLCVAVLLLLASQDVITFDMVWKLSIPIFILIIGANMLFTACRNNDSEKIWKDMVQNGKTIKSVNAIFSSNNVNLSAEKVEGISCKAIFGGIAMDLTNAEFDEDCVINATAVFGGIDIIVPDNVNVVIHSKPFFSGIDSDKHRNSSENTIILHVNATCVFGGIEVK